MKTASTLGYCHWLRQAILALAIVCNCGLTGFTADAATNTPVKKIFGKVHELTSDILRDFHRVNVTSEPAILLIEADPVVSQAPMFDAAGRMRGMERRANPGRTGFIIRIDYTTSANNVRMDRKEERDEFTHQMTKVILSQEKPGDHPDTRTEALLIFYDQGKDLAPAWRDRLAKLLDELASLDVKRRN